MAVSGGVNYGLTRWASEVLLEPEPWEPPPKEELISIALLPPEPESEREEIEPPEPEPAKPEPLRPPPRPEEEEEERELEEPEPPPPEPEVEEPPPPEPEPPQPQPEPPPPMDHEKMVEQLDEFDEKEVPEEYQFLSNINRAVIEQTRAILTNMVEDAREAHSAQLEPAETPEKGDASEDEHAETEQKESRLAREAPPVPAKDESHKAQANDPNPQTQLAMRELAPRSHEPAMLEKEALAREAADGTLSAPQEASASVLPREAQARVESKEKSFAFTLSGREMDAAFGEDLQGARELASKDRSKKKGVWDDVRERYESPLENVVPEIQPGNQTALASRKDPFARYIAMMHRGIHASWAWGFLEGLPSRGAGHALNDMRLATRVEIILNGDGSIYKVNTVRRSGNSVFDAAAKEVIYANAPYPNPPEAIKSPDGRIYIHWGFNRNERACGTFQATPYIRNDVSGGAMDKVPMTGTSHGSDLASAEEMRRLGVNPSQGGESHEGHSHGPPAPGAGSKPAPGAGGPRPVPGARPGGGAPGPVGPSLPPVGTGDDSTAIDPKARGAADAWVLGLIRDKPERMVLYSSKPFRSRGEIVARSDDELLPIFEAMTQEAGNKLEGSVKVYTAAGLRKRFGSVPAGVQEGEDEVYAVFTVSGDTVVLVLRYKFGAWRVVGMTR